MTQKFLNHINKTHFTKTLADMVCSKNFDLQNSLNLMRQMKIQNKKSKNVSLAAAQIYENMLSGQSYSDSLKLCSYIEFDTTYISFIRFAERCGSLDKTLVFLSSKCERETENISKVFQASVYPVFVIILSCFAGAFLYFYMKTNFSAADSSFSFFNNPDFYSCILLSFGFLILFCIAAFFFLKKTLGINKLYEAFLAMGFLTKGGESIANAVSDAVNILGYETKEGRLFAAAGKNLSYGFGLKDSFALNSWNNSIRYELEEAFFYAENSGGENDVFEKIALWLNSRDEKRKALCFKLLEPFFISGTGIFLLIFLMNLVLPMFSELTMYF